MIRSRMKWENFAVATQLKCDKFLNELGRCTRIQFYCYINCYKLCWAHAHIHSLSTHFDKLLERKQSISVLKYPQVKWLNIYFWQKSRIASQWSRGGKWTGGRNRCVWNNGLPIKIITCKQVERERGGGKRSIWSIPKCHTHSDV